MLVPTTTSRPSTRPTRSSAKQAHPSAYRFRSTPSGQVSAEFARRAMTATPSSSTTNSPTAGSSISSRPPRLTHSASRSPLLPTQWVPSTATRSLSTRVQLALATTRSLPYGLMPTTCQTMSSLASTGQALVTTPLIEPICSPETLPLLSTSVCPRLSGVVNSPPTLTDLTFRPQVRPIYL